MSEDNLTDVMQRDLGGSIDPAPNQLAATGALQNDRLRAPQAGCIVSREEAELDAALRALGVDDPDAAVERMRAKYETAIGMTLNEARALWAPITCPECKGNGGDETVDDDWHGWEDCGPCKGAGTVCRVCGDSQPVGTLCCPPDESIPPVTS